MKINCFKLLLVLAVANVATAENWAAKKMEDKVYAKIGKYTITYEELYEAFNEDFEFTDPNCALSRNVTKHAVLAEKILDDVADDTDYKDYTMNDSVKMIEKGTIPYYLCHYVQMYDDEDATEFEHQLNAGRDFYAIEVDDFKRKEALGLVPAVHFHGMPWNSNVPGFMHSYRAHFGDLSRFSFVQDMIFIIKDGEITPKFRGVNKHRYIMKRLMKTRSFSGYVASYSKYTVASWRKESVSAKYIRLKEQLKGYYVRKWLKGHISKMLASGEMTFYDLHGKQIDESQTILSFYKDF